MKYTNEKMEAAFFAAKREVIQTYDQYDRPTSDHTWDEINLKDFSSQEIMELYNFVTTADRFEKHGSMHFGNGIMIDCKHPDGYEDGIWDSEPEDRDGELWVVGMGSSHGFGGHLEKKFNQSIDSIILELSSAVAKKWWEILQK